MEPFLKGVAKYIHTNYSGKTADLAVVFPGKRSRLYLNKYLTEFTDKPTWAPAYFSITELMEKLSGLQAAEKLTLIFELFEVYKKITGTTENIDDFYFYCEMILSDFDDVDKYLVNPDDLFRNLADLKNMGNYFDYLKPEQIEAIQRFWDTFNPGHKSDDQNSFISLWDSLAKVYHEFRKSLAEKKIAYEGMLYRDVAEKIKNSELHLLGFEKYLFVGFNALNKAEDILFEFLKKAGKAEFFWDYDEYYINNSIHEAGFLLRENRIKYPSPLTDINFNNLTSKEKKIKFVSLPSNTGQTAAITEYLKKLEENGLFKDDNAAVILGDESLLMPSIAAIPEEIRDINVSMGYPFKNSVYYDLIFNLAKLGKNSRLNNDGTKAFFYKDVIVLLNHSLLNLSEPDKISSLKKRIISSNTIYIPANDLAINEIFKAIIREPSDSKDIPVYLLDILTILNKSLHKDAEESSASGYDREFLFFAYTTITQLAELIKTSKIEFATQTVYKLLLKSLESLSIPFSGEPLKGIQVLGILETRGLDFENIIMLSLNEGVFPKTGHVPTFIPLSLRHGFGLPVPDHRDALYAYYFYRLIQRAENITLVYNSRHDGLFTGERSRFLHQLFYDPVFKVEEESFITTVINKPPKIIVAQKDQRVMNILSEYFENKGENYLTPSALNKYLNCSLSFYFRYIEGLKEPVEVMEELDPALFGNILHKAIEMIYKPFIEKDITSTLLDEILKNKESLRNTLDEAFNIIYFDNQSAGLLKGRNLILKEIIYKYLEKILMFDKGNAPFKISRLEYKFKLIYEVNDHLKIRLGGIIDRVDEKDGRARIIDYKTGIKKNSFFNIDALFDETGSKRNGAVFQVLLYSMLLERLNGQKDIIPGLYFIRDIFNEKFDFHIVEKENNRIVENALDYSLQFEVKLRTEIEKIFNPEIPFVQTEDIKVCEYCPQKFICHRG